MKNKQEIIDKSKIVLLPHIDCELFSTDYNGYDDYIKSHKSFVVDYIPERYLYVNDKENSHHITTDFHYNYLLPNILRLLDVDFNLYEQFDYINDKNEKGDYSYILPKNNILYGINSIRFEWLYEGHYDMTFYRDSKNDVSYKDLVSVDEIYNKNFMLIDKWGKRNTWVESKYHRLFKYAHQVCKIENKSIKDGKSLLISGDSHTIPLIMPLSIYYKTIYFFDNRWLINLYDIIMGDDYNVDDSLFIMWRNQDISKYLINNLR